ncbi:MAG: hypothetical protein HDS80_04810 [Bacteroidales bacterium]|nr:hypothetical protein [Bacteroidales bacterium]
MKYKTYFLTLIISVLICGCNEKTEKPRQVPYKTTKQKEDSIKVSENTAVKEMHSNEEEGIITTPQNASEYFAEWNGKFKYFDTKSRAEEVQGLSDLHAKYLIFLRHCEVGNGFNTVYSTINAIQYKENEYEPHPEVAQAIGTKLLGKISFSVTGLELEGAQREINYADNLVREAILVSDCASIGRANECLALIRNAEVHYNNAQRLANRKEEDLKRQLASIFR